MFASAAGLHGFELVEGLDKLAVEVGGSKASDAT